jgi:hypothetical protein
MGKYACVSVTTVIHDALLMMNMPITVGSLQWRTLADFRDFMRPPASRSLLCETHVIIDLPPMPGKGGDVRLHRLQIVQAAHARLARRARKDFNPRKTGSLVGPRRKQSIHAMQTEDCLRPNPSPPSLHQVFVNTLLQRVDRSLGGQRVDDLLLGVSMIARTYSYTGYEFLRRYMPLPDISTLFRHYGPRIKDQETNLAQIPRIPFILENLSAFPYATISVDAISLDCVFLSDRNQPTRPQPSHAFVYQCMPLTIHEHCFPV